LKRIVLIVTTAAVLIAAAAAFAATTNVNTYKAGYKFNPSKAGSKKKPQKVSFKQIIQVTPGTPTARAGVLKKITTTIYGLKVDGKHFPTCSIGQIHQANSDTSCPKGSMVASGSITAAVGSATNFTAAAQACDPLLHVWNGGQGKLTFFFVDGPVGSAHDCVKGSITTGKVGPWKATYKQKGKNFVLTVPIPTDVDYPLPGVVGSLQSETLNWKSSTKKGHTSITSVGCKGNKRPYSTGFVAAPITGGASQSKSVPGSAPCKK
jgi:hypothetical protein